MRITYNKATIESRNPLARFAHRYRFRVAERLVKQYGVRGGALLDFGAGDGDFLRRLDEIGFIGERYGYDAFRRPTGDNIAVVSSLDEIKQESLAVITALETLEHLRPFDVEYFVRFAERSLRSGGRLIISVPIMIGPVLFVKYANARLINKSKWRYNIVELFNGGIFLRDVARDTGDKFMNHKGFDFRKLRTRLLHSELKLIHQEFSPLRGLGFAVNSQIFFVLEKTVPR